MNEQTDVIQLLEAKKQAIQLAIYSHADILESEIMMANNCGLYEGVNNTFGNKLNFKNNYQELNLDRAKVPNSLEYKADSGVKKQVEPNQMGLQLIDEDTDFYTSPISMPITSKC